MERPNWAPTTPPVILALNIKSVPLFYRRGGEEERGKRGERETRRERGGERERGRGKGGKREKEDYDTVVSSLTK